MFRPGNVHLNNLYSPVLNVLSYLPVQFQIIYKQGDTLYFATHYRQEIEKLILRVAWSRNILIWNVSLQNLLAGLKHCVLFVMRPWRLWKHAIFNDNTDGSKRGIIKPIEKIFMIRNWKQFITLSLSQQDIFAKAKTGRYKMCFSSVSCTGQSRKGNWRQYLSTAWLGRFK